MRSQAEPIRRAVDLLADLRSQMLRPIDFSQPCEHQQKGQRLGRNLVAGAAQGTDALQIQQFDRNILGRFVAGIADLAGAFAHDIHDGFVR